VSDDEPKTAYELILERLKKKDRDEGVREQPLTDNQRARIAEVRKVYEAKLAEREIFFNQSRRKADDPEALAALEEEYRRDRERLQSERDRKVEQIRNETVG
jgi:aminoglycoside phosphotransferase